MRNCHLKKSKQTSVKNNSYKSPTKFLQNCRRLDKVNNRRHAARLCLRGYAPVSAPARKQPLRGDDSMRESTQTIYCINATVSTRPFHSSRNSSFVGLSQQNPMLLRSNVNIKPWLPVFSPGTDANQAMRCPVRDVKRVNAVRQIWFGVAFREARLVSLDSRKILERPGGKVAKHDVVVRCRPRIAVKRLPKRVLSG